MKIWFSILAFLLCIPRPYAKDRTIDVDSPKRFNVPWVKQARTEEQAVMTLFNMLAGSTTGKEIMRKASDKAALQGKTLQDVVSAGSGSVTDTTLVRKFSEHDPTKVSYETRSHVYIDRSLVVVDAILDLAHELTHYVYRAPFNPYRPAFSARDFIVATVEGKGGEVDAYLVECKVYKELFGSKQDQFRSRCSTITDDNGQLSRELAMQQFYKVGHHYKLFQDELKAHAVEMQELPMVGKDEAMFISSAYGLPYPLAALREYQGIMGKVCDNDFKRLALMKQQVGRSPASIGSMDSSEQKRFNDFFTSYQARCEKFIDTAEIRQ